MIGFLSSKIVESHFYSFTYCSITSRPEIFDIPVRDYHMDVPSAHNESKFLKWSWPGIFQVTQKHDWIRSWNGKWRYEYKKIKHMKHPWPISRTHRLMIIHMDAPS